MGIKQIIDLILAIPQIYGMIKKLINSIQKAKEASRQSELNSGIEAAKVAQTKEELKKANEQITSHLP